MRTHLHTHQIKELKYHYLPIESVFHKHLAKPCGQSFIGSRTWFPICIVLHVFSTLSELKRIKHNILLICFSLQNEKSKPGFNNTYWLKKGLIASKRERKNPILLVKLLGRTFLNIRCAMEGITRKFKP